ncbi:MAG: hypothetical protein K9L23_19770 [Desulfotignum sp.]|nr:hypothetical protein [Desulfotignum sp.]MCF8090287.1 hypothetical protein [Desulfotignum sp.]
MKYQAYMSLDLHSDTHMHSTYSDGSATIAEMAEAAFEKGMTTIASVHTLVVGGTFCLLNGNETEFHTCLNTIFKKDIRSLCRAYYHARQEAVQTGWFDIVGHMDVLKKFNTHHRFFNETEAWYRELVEDTLDAVRDRKMKLEINMGAMASSGSKARSTTTTTTSIPNRE